MLKSILNSPSLQPIVIGQVRHLLTVGGTALATNGYIGKSDVEIGVGAALTLIAIIWSAISKRAAA